jgi:hypothetical protein
VAQKSILTRCDDNCLMVSACWLSETPVFHHCCAATLDEALVMNGAIMLGRRQLVNVWMNLVAENILTGCQFCRTHVLRSEKQNVSDLVSNSSR